LWPKITPLKGKKKKLQSQRPNNLTSNNKIEKNQFQKKKHWKTNLIHPGLTWLTHDPRYKDQIWFKNNEEKFITTKKFKKNKTNSNKILRIKSYTKTKWKKIIRDKINKKNDKKIAIKRIRSKIEYKNYIKWNVKGNKFKNINKSRNW